MTKKTAHSRNIAKRISSPAKKFINDSRSVGIVLICCTFLSMLLSNGRLSNAYTGFWEREIHLPASSLNLPHTISHLINDLLMALFFFLAGLEIKRELLAGELSSLKKSMLPVLAALGGMVMPALIYLFWCGSTPFSNGWAIPMATDIAFSLAVLSLLGKRAPLSLRIFLTALAIIDDLGGIVTIAIFYTESIDKLYLFLAMGSFFALVFMNLLKVRSNYLYFIPGAFLWYFVFNSGIHATIAGVLLALTIPLHKIDRLEHVLHHPINFIILPLFALANTAIVLPSTFTDMLHSPIHYGILAGLILGKPMGIFLFGLAAVKLKLADLPPGMGWPQLWGTGMVAGIGFTMSIFIAMLAFQLPGIQLIAKVSVIEASIISGVAGFFFLKSINHKQKNIQATN